MTREVAIDNLKADIKYWENTSVSTEHLYMAIEALEQEPCDDCVSIQAVNEILLKYVHSEEGKLFTEFLISQIKDLPPVLPKREQSEWILVREGLPKIDGSYRVIQKSGGYATYVFHKDGNSEEYWKRCAVAWMPIPEYEG